MEQHGHVPLPPYIDPHRQRRRRMQRYQTVFARHPGAVAAPTAALHFDEALLAALDARCAARQCDAARGCGHLPARQDRHHCRSPHAQRALCRPQATSGRHCGLPRSAAAAWWPSGQPPCARWNLGPQTGQAAGDTAIFITPGSTWKVVDRLITNFHLPKSTLMMLVSALAGHAHVMALYRHAIAQQYRFFSYGDAMLLDRTA
jgi:S-adenosylmethionine:tRNA ribosyltransferase-isomerase